MARMPMAQRREALVRASLSVIAADGLTAATTRAICHEANMPLASFHYVFESYNDFIAELVREVLKADAVSFKNLVTEEKDLLACVQAGFRVFLDRLVAEPGQAALGLELWMLVKRTPELQHLTSIVHERFRELSARSLVQLEAYGYVWDSSIDDLSFQLNLIANGLAMGCAAGGELKGVYRAAEGLAVGIAAQGHRIDDGQRANDGPGTG